MFGNDDAIFFGDDPEGEFGFDPLGGIVRTAKRVAHSAGSAAGSAKGAVIALAHGKVKTAGQKAAGVVNAVASNRALQAGWPGSFVPAAVASAAAKGGPKAAIAEAKRVVANPTLRSEVAAAAVIFPPIKPLTGGAVAAVETAARVNDSLASGNPARIAQAAMQVAATTAAAMGGNAGAARALSAFKSVETVGHVTAALKAGVPAAKAAVSQAKAAGKAGEAALSVAKMLSVRSALVDSVSKDPSVRKRAQELLTALQKSNPSLVQAVKAAFESPKGLKIGKFSILRTGRILLDGKPIRKASGTTARK